MERQASLGDSWVLPYALSSRFTPEEQRWFLDRCADQGVKVMVPLASTVGSNTRNLDPWIHAGVWLDWVRTQAILTTTGLPGMPPTDWFVITQVRGNISIVSNHSAVLGYYICDDCCPFAPNSGPIGNVSEQAILYNCKNPSKSPP